MRYLACQPAFCISVSTAPPLQGLSVFLLPCHSCCCFFLCTRDLDFPPLLFYQYFCPITAYTINAVASPPSPGHFFCPLSHLLLLLSCSGCETGVSPLTTPTSPSQSLASSLSALSLINSFNFVVLNADGGIPSPKLG